jgi:hypothetical protein
MRFRSNPRRIEGPGENTGRDRFRLPERLRYTRQDIHHDLNLLLGRLLALLLKPFIALWYALELKVRKTLNWRRIPWFKLGLLLLLSWFLFQENWTFNLSLQSPFGPGGLAWVENSGQSLQQNVSILTGASGNQAESVATNAGDEKARAYIKRFAKVAVQEMHEYKVPASIKMAQALIESHSGKSRLAKESNNHFGIKCRSKCKGCTCRNYSDDDAYDMFRVFDSAWESWREHSILLTSFDRYRKLQKYGKDYKKWASGLKRSGYATDKNYDKKLIRIIEKYKLYKLDEM